MKKEYNSNAHTFLRTEAFCAEIITNSASFDHIRLLSDSNFKKSFRNDIEEVSFKLNEDKKGFDIDLLVNRDSIYDRLPEGLFHQTRGNSKTQTTLQMTEEHRRFKEEENEARKFFQPIEQEFFRYSTMVEQEEVNLAFGILNGNLKSELYRFWDIPNGLPEECVRKLVQIMPWAKMIKGNIAQTAKALEIILDKPVTYEQLCNENHGVPGTIEGMGSGELGIDMVLGSSFWEPALCWKLYIADIKKKDIADYRPNSPYGKLLKHFEEIFIPLQIDVIFEYEVLPAEDFETEDILGFGLVL